MSTSPRTCAPACQPLHPPQEGPQPGLCPAASTKRAAFDNHPSAVMRPKLFCPISRKRSCNARTSLVRALLPVQPLHPPPKALQRGPYSPGPRRDARGLRQPPVCHVAPKISCPISHILSQSLVHLACLSTPSTAAKMPLTSIPFETGTLPANQTTESWPSRLPFRNTQYAIQRPTCSFPLARAWTTV